ncbi:hypothetical protein B0H13DRAFT_826611 [Mycena leptocephala]|nr:hypothetical protein B0H13DRAFT_826611 [Mycena leptocephala]
MELARKSSLADGSHYRAPSAGGFDYRAGRGARRRRVREGQARAGGYAQNGYGGQNGSAGRAQGGGGCRLLGSSRRNNGWVGRGREFATTAATAAQGCTRARGACRLDDKGRRVGQAGVRADGHGEPAGERGGLYGWWGRKWYYGSEGSWDAAVTASWRWGCGWECGGEAAEHASGDGACYVCGDGVHGGEGGGQGVCYYVRGRMDDYSANGRRTLPRRRPLHPPSFGSLPCFLFPLSLSDSCNIPHNTYTYIQATHHTTHFLFPLFFSLPVFPSLHKCNRPKVYYMRFHLVHIYVLP